MKSDPTFVLEHAAWPVLVAEASGTIRHANQAAIALFGPRLEGDMPSLAAVWNETGETPEQFLARWDRSAPSVLRLSFRVKGGGEAIYTTHICPTREAHRRYVLQLIGEPAGPPTGLEGIGGSAATPAPAANSGDTFIIHKQKLDCALHLARTVSLDFNNALTGILAHNSLLLGLAEPDHPWRPALVEIEKSGQRAAEITHQLALFSRPEKDAGARPGGNLNSVLRRVVEILRPSRSPSLTWSLHLEPRLYSTSYDEAKMQQAFARILENSLEAMDERGEISVASTNVDLPAPMRDESIELPAGSYVCVEIADTGPGIPPAVLPRIFEPFFTTKPGHRGLGLAWVYGIVTNHRGLVAVSSQPGRGVSIRVYMPATRQLVADPGGSFDALRGDQTILAVDNEPLILSMCEVVLGAFGYRVLTASSGPRALEMLAHAEHRVDLVIVDVVMPQMSGLELADEIRLLRPTLPLLLVSGLPRSQAGLGETFLAKPFSSQDLLARVRQILDARSVSGSVSP